MSNINFPCWSCGKTLKARPTDAGKRCLCQSCDEMNTIPGQRDESAPIPPVRVEAPVEPLPEATPPPVYYPTPTPPQYQATNPVPLGIRVFKWFVIVIAVMCTLGLGLMLVEISRDGGAPFMYKYGTFDKAEVMAWRIGGWVSCMLVLGVIYLVAELAAAAHKRK